MKLQSTPRGITALNLTASVTQSGERAGPRRFRLTTPGTEDLGVERAAPKSEGRRAGRRPRDENPQDVALINTLVCFTAGALSQAWRRMRAMRGESKLSVRSQTCTHGNTVRPSIHTHEGTKCEATLYGNMNIRTKECCTHDSHPPHAEVNDGGVNHQEGNKCTTS